MAKQIIGIGNIADDGRGDTLRTAGEKINANFTEVYNNISTFNSSLATLGQNLNALVVPTDISQLADSTNVIPTDVSDLTDTGNTLFSGDYNDLTNLPTIVDLTAVATNIVPATDIAYDLGSSTNRFRDLYLSGNTIYIGNTTLSALPNGGIVLPTNTTIPGVVEYEFKPDYVDFQDTGFNTPYDDVTIIDQLTYQKALQSGTATVYSDQTFTPTVYTAVTTPGSVAGTNDLTGIDVTTAHYYPEGSNGEIVNTDNMILLHGIVDITNPGAILTTYNSGSYDILTSTVVSIGENYADVRVGSLASEGDINIDGVISAGLGFLYNPTDPLVWASPAPTTVGEAIDRLADAIMQLNGGNQI